MVFCFKCALLKPSSPGGQNVNQSQNCVQLKHIPSQIVIKCHETRYLEQNRKLARKYLFERLDDLQNPECSLNRIKHLKAVQRAHNKKSLAKRRAENKLAEKQNAEIGEIQQCSK